MGEAGSAKGAQGDARRRLDNAGLVPGLVSVVTPFLNAERFLQEAVGSVFAQTCQNWELLLIDDGSRDGSSAIARGHAACNPEKVRYLEHEGHQNLGATASRNLGFDHAGGEYVALLDSDDVWSPSQLEEQVRLLAECPAAGMVYGNTLYWRSWTGDPADQVDWLPDMGVPDHSLLAPPTLISRFVRQTALLPCPSSVLARTEALVQIGGGEESFRSFDEDAVLFFKMALRFPVLVVNRCWGKYRLHPRSSMATIKPVVAEMEHLRAFDWLAAYATKEGVTDSGFWEALSNRLWPYRHFRLHKALAGTQSVANELGHLCRSVSRRLQGQSTGRIVATPNPISFGDETTEGITTLSWSAHGAKTVEVRVGTPDGQLFSRSGPSGSKQTGAWIADGMVFWLRDVSSGAGLSRGSTIASVKIRTIAPARRDRERFRPDLLFSEKYDAEFGRTGMDGFLSGNYQLRNQALAEWILETAPRRVFEFAAGGAGLAMLLEKAVQDYVWSDFARTPISAARKLLTKAAIRRIDVRDGFRAIPWGRFDTVVCVSPGDLSNDLEVLSAVSPGTNVFLSCATFEEPLCARAFPTEQSVRDRFAGLLEIGRVKVVGDQILLHGVRKDREYTAWELRRAFFSRRDEYLRNQPRMHRFVARHLHGRVLELGCADGYLFPYLNCEKYVGVDPCEEAVGQARKQHEAEFLVSDWREPACAGPFDSLYLNGVLSGVTGKMAAARRLERFHPTRIVVQDLEEVPVKLPYKLRASKEFRLDGDQPERFRRRVVRVFDL
jgi:hypothetical protein